MNFLRSFSNTAKPAGAAHLLTAHAAMPFVTDFDVTYGNALAPAVSLLTACFVVTMICASRYKCTAWHLLAMSVVCTDSKQVQYTVVR